MNAESAVRNALGARLRGDPALSGVPVFTDASPSPALPRIELGDAQAVDWSATGFHGRELRTAAIVRVGAGQRGRLGALTAAAERAGEGLAGDIGGWRVAGAVFLKSRGNPARDGSVSVLVEHRVRVVETQASA